MANGPVLISKWSQFVKDHLSRSGFDRQYAIEVFNNAGQLVRSSLRSGLVRIELDLKVLTAGVYTFRATDNEGNVTNLPFVKI